MAEEKEKASTVAEDLAEVLAAVAGTTALVAQEAAVHPAMIAAAAVTLPKALRTGVAWWQERKRKRLVKWWEEFLRAAEMTEEQCAAILGSHANDPSFSDIIGETAREVFDSMVDEAAIPLAKLVKEYFGVHAPDWFSRGFSRMLQTFDRAEIAALKELVEQATSLPFKSESFILMDLGPDEGLLLEHHQDGVLHRIRPAPWGQRIFTALARNGLVEDRTGAHISFGGGRSCVAEVAVFRRIHALLG